MITISKIYVISHHTFTSEILPPKPNHITHQIQTDDIDIEFSNTSTDYIKIIVHQISYGANSNSQTLFFQLFIASYLYQNCKKNTK